MSDLDDQLKKAEKDLADLKNGSEAEKAELQKQINSLKEQLDEANAKVTVLKAEKERLTEEKNIPADRTEKSSGRCSEEKSRGSRSTQKSSGRREESQRRTAETERCHDTENR